MKSNKNKITKNTKKKIKERNIKYYITKNITQTDTCGTVLKYRNVSDSLFEKLQGRDHVYKRRQKTHAKITFMYTQLWL